MIHGYEWFYLWFVPGCLSRGYKRQLTDWATCTVFLSQVPVNTGCLTFAPSNLLLIIYFYTSFPSPLTLSIQKGWVGLWTIRFYYPIYYINWYYIFFTVFPTDYQDFLQCWNSLSHDLLLPDRVINYCPITWYTVVGWCSGNFDRFRYFPVRFIMTVIDLAANIHFVMQ
jgi:hypothetical protein